MDSFNELKVIIVDTVTPFSIYSFVIIIFKKTRSVRWKLM